ncbi:pyruvate kinase [candidate division WWE3 bacterium CG_4_10_14_0_2_um_filter_41_14]|uniref:Pyruvate kinase n=1 Tax=candidate division WWE3 bacterium CG_4_10_14_0_2_um_filter_41_14 TaxID=1975072 RepID=A0A2M7TJS5_UNCKA|nr:MAG: pyruvate kinase [candidate division WWE3 bacterium CG_4_10_14_0_2_um_filter_41_14]
MSKTKIVATIGPACESDESIRAMITSGVSVFRFNTKHNESAWHEEAIGHVRKIAQEISIPTGILVDLQGPEIRVNTPEKKPLSVLKDQKVIFSYESQPNGFCIPTRQLYEALSVGVVVVIDDGKYVFTVTKVTKESFTARATEDYTISDRKGMNVPGVRIDLPLLTSRDHTMLEMCERVNPDFIALSFVRDKNDVLHLREELSQRNLSAHIVSKIEGKQAIENIEEIIDSSDAIMVARGDLGIELPFEQITYWQKLIIKRCRLASKPVITATEMLQSMVENPRPTRAEVSDVSNAVFDGTDATMLSAESATGTYPVQAVRVMEKIASFNEGKSFVPSATSAESSDQTRVMTHAVVDILEHLKNFTIDAVVVFTETGRTVRDLSRFRSHIPIYAITENEQIQNQLTLSYGVIPFLVSLPVGVVLEIDSVVTMLKEKKILSEGKRVIFVHGDHWKIPGLTNTITIKEV